MSQAIHRSPLRILLACARPLILKVEHWEAELNDAANRVLCHCNTSTVAL